MKHNSILLIGCVFMATLAIVFGQRLSDEAMAVVVGAICGISASIPISIGFVIAATRQQWGRADNETVQPPSIVIVPNQTPMFRHGATTYYLPNPQEVKTVGTDD